MSRTVDLAYPFTGRCLVQNSPADRVPSHGTTLFASSQATASSSRCATSRTAASECRWTRLPTSPRHTRALVRVLDLTERFCREETCYSTVGGLIVYFDGGHMSASYARTLAPALTPEVSAALGRREA